MHRRFQDPNSGKSYSSGLCSKISFYVGLSNFHHIPDVIRLKVETPNFRGWMEEKLFKMDNVEFR